MTSYSKSLLVSWDGEGGGGKGGRGRALLDKRVLLGKKVPLSGRALLDRKVAF